MMRSRTTNAFVALGVIGLVMLLVLPLPPLLLDLFLSLSILFAVITLLLTLYVENALEFSAFPSLLLFLTLFRLSLNIASTRMILTRMEAGNIIRTFGDFMTGGNAAIGLILFVLLTIVNFLVVTKGASRIAEVAARFTLEALPGKQMAVDADLQAGLLSQEEAKVARGKVGEEAHFYGAMDGASRFVRGDAIAGLLIILVNLVGGFVMGLTAHKMSFNEVWHTLALLTVGDGLVTQVPALFVSVGAGIIMTRASSGSVGSTLPAQMMGNPQVMWLAAGTLVALGLIQGMPHLIMIAMGGALGLYAFTLRPKKAVVIESPRTKGVEEALTVYPLEVNLGLQRIEQAPELFKSIPQIRKELAAKLGVVVPAIHIADDLSLGKREYSVKIRGVKVFLSDEGRVEEIAKRVATVIESNAHTLLNRQEVAKMVEKARLEDSAVVEELIPSKITSGHILKVLQNLLREHIPIRDFVSILEVMADHLQAGGSNDPEILTEKVRLGLAKGISEHFFGKSKVAHAITLDPKVEEMLRLSYQKQELALRPKTMEKIEERVAELFEQNSEAVVVTSATSRKGLQKLLERRWPHVPVLSFGEIAPDITMTSVGVISNDVLI